MYSRRIHITGTLVADSPFHPGSGEFRLAPELARDGGDAQPRLALVARDALGRPYLAGTAIKGVLRRQAGETETTKVLFGAIKDESTGAMGRLIVYGAPMQKAGDARHLPRGANGLFVAARTGIDGATGTVDEGRLFYQEMIAPGARFALRMVYLPAREADQTVWDLLVRLLKGLQEGVSFGKGQADGQGWLRLDGAPKVEEEGLQADGTLKRAPLAGFAADLARAGVIAGATRWRLRLVCDGPFMINDWSFVPEASTRQEADRIQLKAQTRADKIPELPGTSLMGALRARAEWLGKTRVLDAERVKRLFGGMDRAAVLRMNRLTATRCETCRLTSVVIDRFSGAPVDNKLFTAEAFVRPTFEVELSLAPGRGTADDETAITALIDDLCDEGLMLGHGTNKGFGWFTVTAIRDGGA